MGEVAGVRKMLLTSLLEGQGELLRLSLYVATQGPTIYQGERLQCTLSEAKLKTSQPIALGAGQSVATIEKSAELKGIPVRDLYPIARSAVESFINAAFLVVEDESVAQRAVRWMKYRSWKQANREFGSGEFMIRISTSPKGVPEPAEFAEFTAKGASKEWTTLDTASRIRRIGEIAGHKAGGRFIGAYGRNYSISSEIIHGSPFGVNYFYQAHLKPSGTVEDFIAATAKQVEDILMDVFLAQAGYLAAFFRSQKMSAPYLAEQELFNRLVVSYGKEPIPMEYLA